MVNTVKKLIFVILILSAGFSLAGQKEDLKSLQNGNDIHSENIAEILPLAQKEMPRRKLNWVRCI